MFMYIFFPYKNALKTFSRNTADFPLCYDFCHSRIPPLVENSLSHSLQSSVHFHSLFHCTTHRRRLQDMCFFTHRISRHHRSLSRHIFARTAQQINKHAQLAFVEQCASRRPTTTSWICHKTQQRLPVEMCKSWTQVKNESACVQSENIFWIAII